MDEDNEDLFKNGVQNCLKPEEEYDQSQWNRRMRNLFEAVGMLGVACSDDIRCDTLENAIKIIESPERRGFPYANYATAYNAVRCVERLHSSGPESYCRYRRGSRREEGPAEHDVPYLKPHAYAVRGFHRKRQAVAIETPMPLRDYEPREVPSCMHGTKGDKDLERRTVQCLKSALERLIDLPELDKHQEFMAANLSLAVIRWLPHDDEEVVWLRAQQSQAKQKKYSPVVANLELALYYRGKTRCAYKTIGNRIVAASEVEPTSLLQALITDVTLERTRHGCRLDVSIPENPAWIWTSSQKARFIRQCSKGKASIIAKLQTQFEEILIGCKKTTRDFGKELKDSGMQLRFASGGTLPILEINSTEYYCLFYREIHPIGWNIANGGTANHDETFNPVLTIQREFAEELVIIDGAQGFRYHFYKEAMNDKNRDSVLRLLETLNLKSSTGEWKDTLLTPTLVPSLDRIKINGIESPKEVILNVNADDLGIEIDQVVKIGGLGKTVSILDGETEKSYSVHTATPGFINAPVGLFRKDQLLDPKSACEFIPDILFRSGQLECGSFENNGSNDEGGGDHDLRESVEELLDQFAKERLESLPSDSWDAYEKAREQRQAYVLCPATRTLLRRYVT